MIVSKDKSTSNNPESTPDLNIPGGVASKLEMYRLLVDELIKDEPNKSKVRDYCKFLKIPYSLNSATQIGTVFNRLQSLNRQVIND